MAGRKKIYTEEGKMLRKQLYDQVNYAFKMEGVNPNAIASIIGAGLTTVYGIRKNRDISTYNLVRILDALGYEIKLAKIPGRLAIADDPIMREKIKHFNTKQLYAKRKERNQKLIGPLPARVRIKKGRGDKLINIISRRQLEAESNLAKTPLFKPFGGNDEIPGSVLP